jgi:hypothetical protein
MDWTGMEHSFCSAGLGSSGCMIFLGPILLLLTAILYLDQRWATGLHTWTGATCRIGAVGGGRMGISFILAAVRKEMGLGQDGTGWTRTRERVWIAQRICVGRSGVGSWGLGVGVLAGRPRDRGSAGCDASLRGSFLLSLLASRFTLH